MAQGSGNALLDQLRERLAPAQWPLPLARLPEGTALVGGAVRDGLLDRLQEQPDLDLVVPSDAIALTKACLLYTSPSPRDVEESRMPSSA